MGVFQFATLFYIFIVTYLCNPHNKEASLTEKNHSTSYKYFDESVGKNVPHAIFIISLTSGIATLVGSWMVTFKKEGGKGAVPQQDEIELPQVNPEPEEKETPNPQN